MSIVDINIGGSRRAISGPIRIRAANHVPLPISATRIAPTAGRVTAQFDMVVPSVLVLAGVGGVSLVARTSAVQERLVDTGIGPPVTGASAPGGYTQFTMTVLAGPTAVVGGFSYTISVVSTFLFWAQQGVVLLTIDLSPENPNMAATGLVKFV